MKKREKEAILFIIGYLHNCNSVLMQIHYVYYIVFLDTFHFSTSVFSIKMCPVSPCLPLHCSFNLYSCLSFVASSKTQSCHFKSLYWCRDVRGASLLCRTTPSLSHCDSSPQTGLPSSQITVSQINELVHWPHRHTHRPISCL